MAVKTHGIHSPEFFYLAMFSFPKFLSDSICYSGHQHCITLFLRPIYAQEKNKSMMESPSYSVSRISSSWGGDASQRLSYFINFYLQQKREQMIIASTITISTAAAELAAAMIAGSARTIRE